MEEGYKVEQEKEEEKDNEEEQDNEEAQDNEEELEEEQEEEEDNEEEQGGDDEQEGEEQEGGGEEDYKNNLMSFVLELESVAGEDDKAYIERLWKKRWDLVKDLKETQIDERDTDPDTDKGEDQDKRAIEGFKERVNNYFKHCNREKIETLRVWSNKLLKDKNKMEKELRNTDNYEMYICLIVLNNPLHKQRKLLQKVQVGNGIMHAIKTIALAYINYLLKTGKI